MNVRRLVSYYGVVCARAWRDTVAFLKAQIIVGLLLAISASVVSGWVSADVGEKFNARIAIYAAVLPALVAALVAFAWNVVVSPWRLHEEQRLPCEKAMTSIAEKRRPGMPIPG